MGTTESYFGCLDQAAPAVKLQHLIAGFWISQAIAVVADVAIADLLAAGPRSSAQLAQASGADPSALYRLLRAVASVGICAEVRPKTFVVTEMAELLRTDAQGSLHDMALYLCGVEHWRTWGHLRHSVQTGQSAFDLLYGMSPWEYRTRHPGIAARFEAAMVSVGAQVAEAVVDAYDFSVLGSVVDVGGGHGGLLIAILRANPALRAILLDLPHVAAGAAVRLREADLAPRWETVGGDMFRCVPHGGDAYVLSRVIHDWDDERAVIVLRNCRRAMGPESRLLVVEEVIAAGNLLAYGKLSDLNMLVSPGGQERTEAEYRALYDEAGLELTRIVPTRSRVSIVEGRPA